MKKLLIFYRGQLSTLIEFTSLNQEFVLDRIWVVYDEISLNLSIIMHIRVPNNFWNRQDDFCDTQSGIVFVW